MNLNLKSVNGVTIQHEHRTSCHFGAIVASWFQHAFLSLTAMAEFYDLIIRNTFSRQLPNR